MTDISKRYNKEVLVAENAYAYTLNDGDNFSNNFGPSQEQLGGYKATIQGQAQEVRDVMNAVAQVPEQKGLVFSTGSRIGFQLKERSGALNQAKVMGGKIRRCLILTAMPSHLSNVFNRVSAGNGENFTAEAARFTLPRSTSQLEEHWCCQVK